MTGVRHAAVADLFYPGDPAQLADAVCRLLDAVPAPRRPPKALIVPHAGYVYSGPVAATAYAALKEARARIRRVVLLGPSHRVPLRGIAVPSADAFETPLGSVRLDREALDDLTGLDGLIQSDTPHRAEHALEVQLPFLQTQLESFRLVPMVVGDCSPALVANALDRVWGGEETLIVVSSDLSHYHPYDLARRLDAATRDAILRRETDLSGDRACGCHAVNGLLLVAGRRGLEVTELDLRNSGDTAGDRQRVVGYGAFAIHEA